MGRSSALNAQTSALNAIHLLEGSIRQLAGITFHMAADPDSHRGAGPAFISLKSVYQPTSDYDGMLGSIIMGGFLMDAFAVAANDNSLNDMTTTALVCSAMSGRRDDVDILSEAVNQRSRLKDERRAEFDFHGRGSFAQGTHKKMANIFKDDKPVSLAQAAFQSTLRKRKNIESTIVHLDHVIDGIKRSMNAIDYSPAAV